MTKRRSALVRAYGLASVSGLALVMAGGLAGAGAAQAQGTAAQTGTPQIETVTVTAEKRTERAVDVPATVTTLSATDLSNAGVHDMQGLSTVTPGLSVNRTGAYLQPTIRGIGTVVTGPGSDPNVALYIDGIYQPSQLGNIFNFNNIQSIDVLKGPQGTLFGRNATGGAILITTPDPSFDFGMRLSARYGSYNYRAFNAYATAGLTDNLAADLAVYSSADDGFQRNLVTGRRYDKKRDISVRSKVLFTPSNDMKFVLTLGYSSQNDPTTLDLEAANGNALAKLLVPTTPIATAPGQSSLDFAPASAPEVYSASLKSEFQLDDHLTLTSYTAYRDETTHVRADLDMSELPIVFADYKQKERTFSQEFDLNGQTKNLNWVAGVFYYLDDGSLPHFLVNVVPTTSSSLKTDAYAVFADGTYKLGDNLSIIAGIRYNSEQKKYKIGLAAPGSPLLIDTSHTWSDWTSRAGLRYALDPNSNIYATFSQGFKSGTYNASALSNVPVAPEQVEAYEVGYKTSRDTFQFSLSGYYYDYSNIQVNVYDFSSGVAKLQNAARAEIYGLDAEGFWAVTDRLTVNAGLAYTHARYTSFPNASLYEPLPGGLGNYATSADVSGNRMIRAPEFSANLQISYTQPLRDGSRVQVTAAPQYSSRVYFTFDNRLSQPAYATLNLQATWFSPDDRWSVGLWGKNVTDKRYAILLQETALGDQVVWSAPSMVGVSVDFNY